METTKKLTSMEIKKQKLSKLFRLAHQLRKLENLSLSKALRKAWVLFTSLTGNYRFQPNLFDFSSIDIICKSECIGTLCIMNDGFMNAKNRLNGGKIFKNRHDAIKFAISVQKNKAISQLPLL